VSFASGEDVVLSSSVRYDPEVEDLLGDSDAMTEEPFEALLRGYDEESFRLWRVSSREE
jgi:hypothetical protein